MADANTVVEGRLKYRDGKKWKLRWCVIKKPSPVADRLQVLLFKDVRDVIRGGHPKNNFPLEDFYGLESGIGYDKEPIVLAIICQKVVTLLAFELREYLIQFEIKIRRSLGEEHQFPVRIAKIPQHSKLPMDMVHLHIHGQKFALTAYFPPKILMSWQISDLRRFGMIDCRFCFEGGSRCGKGAGLYALVSDQAEDIADAVKMASLGKTPSCKRQSVKRRSQLSEYLEPVKTVVGGQQFKDFHNTAVAGQNFQEGGLWPKRHSVSLMNYCSSDKKRLSSIENLDKDRLIAIYDVPPKQIRKVENKTEDKTRKRTFSDNIKNSRLRNLTHPNWSLTDLNTIQPRLIFISAENVSSAANNFVSCSDYFGSCDCDDYSVESAPASLSTDYPLGVSCSAPLLYSNQQSTTAGGQQKALSTSEPIQMDCKMLNAADRKLRQEALDSLKQHEIDLQREMSLLEEMLQSCQQEEKKTKDESNVSLKPPPLPKKSMRHWDKQKSLLLEDSNQVNTAAQKKMTRNSSGSMLSPSLLSRLRNISHKSKKSAPLPYVNLSKYDVGDVAGNHVDLSELSLLAEKSSTWDGSNIRSTGNVSFSASCAFDNKENTGLSCPVETLRRRSGSESLISNIKRTLIREPIYANERRWKLDTPPPELPPKGPALVQKNKQRQLNVPAFSCHPPPLPPDRRKSYGSHPRLESRCVQYPMQISESQEPYLMTSKYDHLGVRRSSYDSSQRRDKAHSSVPSHMASRDTGAGYVDMTGMFIPEPSAARQSTSVETQTQIQAGDSLRTRHLSDCSQGGATKVTVYTRDTNYMLMSSMQESYKPTNETVDVSVEAGEMHSLPVSVASIVTENRLPHGDEKNQQSPVASAEKEEKNNGLTPMKAIVPFPRLINFKTQSDTSNKSSQNGTTSKETKDKHNSNINSNKNSNFFTRIIRRNSKDRKSISQSQENLMSSSSSESQINRNKHEQDSVASLNSSDSSVGCKIKSELTTTILPPEPVISSVTLVLDASKMIGHKGSRNGDGKDMVIEDLEAPEKMHNDFQEISISQKNGPSVVLKGETIEKPIDCKCDYGVDINKCVSSGKLANSSNVHSSMLNTSVQTEERVADMMLDSSVQTEEQLDTYVQAEEIVEDVFEISVKTEVEHCVNAQKGVNDGLETLVETEVSDDATETCVQAEVSDDATETCVQTEGDSNDGVPQTAVQTESEGSGILELCVKTDDKVDMLLTKNLSPGKLTQSETGIFTVLHVSSSSQTESHKTDDEKLIELYRSTNLPGVAKCSDGVLHDSLGKELSLNQQAAAIARHVTSLPPFVPPKMKTQSLLCPVLETATVVSKQDHLCESDQTDISVQAVKLRDPASRKIHAKATLRITPPSEDENGNIWIPQGDVLESSNTETVPYVDVSKNADGEGQFSTLVVEVDEADGKPDSLSISSNSSGNQSEETVRSSPASTILRPRSGKNYQMIERRRLMTDSPDSSPGITPNSPTNTSIFTFDLQSFSSKLSVFSKEGESPKTPMHTLPSPIPAHIKSLESIGSHKQMYMNVDMTPPPSPLVLSTTPTSKQSERQLYYPEIDLSLPSRKQIGKVKKPMKKTASKKKVVPYAMIDMVATAAAQKAGKEHAQSRVDSHLRISSQISTSQSQNDQKSSISHAGMKVRKPSTSSVE